MDDVPLPIAWSMWMACPVPERSDLGELQVCRGMDCIFQYIFLEKRLGCQSTEVKWDIISDCFCSGILDESR